MLQLYSDFEKQLALFATRPAELSESQPVAPRERNRVSMRLPAKLSTIEEKLQKVAAKEAPVTFENHLGTMERIELLLLFFLLSFLILNRIRLPNRLLAYYSGQRAVEDAHHADWGASVPEVELYAA